jgi:hypothetical protein
MLLLLLVAQKNEKEVAAKQRALTEAIRSEQQNEELNGFHRTKRPGTVSSMCFILLLMYSKEVLLDDDHDDWGSSPKMVMMNRLRLVFQVV